jgi:hypothetical protein
MKCPQKPLFSPEGPPLSQKEAQARLEVLVQIAEAERVIRVTQASRRLLVERLQQVPERN